MTRDELLAESEKQIAHLHQQRDAALARERLTADYQWEPGWTLVNRLPFTEIDVGWIRDAATLRHRVRESREYLATVLGYWTDTVGLLSPYPHYTLVTWRPTAPRNEDDINGQYRISAWVANEILQDCGVLSPDCRLEADPTSLRIVCPTKEP